MEDTSDGKGVHSEVCSMETDESSRQFNVDEQPLRGKAAVCRACRQFFDRGDLRIVQKEKAHLKNGWYLHLDCIHDGIRHDDTFDQITQISSSNMARLQEVGGYARNTPCLDDDMGHAQPGTLQLQRASVFEDNTLRNMSWWSDVDVVAAITGCTVHTWEGAHPSLEAGLEEAKLAVLQMVVASADSENIAAWKLLMLIDRLMYARIPAKLRPKDVSATQFRKRAVANRLRRFWRGEWQSLWDEARITARALPTEQPTGEEDLRQLVKRIESLGAANEWGKALKAVQSNTPLITDAGRIGELRSKFPKEMCQPLQPKETNPADHESFWSEVAEQVRKFCKRLPRKTGPAWDGSRFEHWMVSSSDSEFAGAIAEAAICEVWQVACAGET